MTGRKSALALALASAVGLGGCGLAASAAGVHDAPAPTRTVAALPAAAAQRVATRVLTAAEAAETQSSQAPRAAVMTGSALTMSQAAANLGEAGGPQAGPVTRPNPPRVLAISRGTGWPRTMLVQDAAADGSVVLGLLRSTDARSPYRLAASATMHPGTSVAALDPLAQGSAIGSASGLTTTPDAVLAQLAASLAYPKPGAAPDVDTTDHFSSSVRANATATAKGLGALATFTQVHRVVPGQTVVVPLAGGGALVFGLLERVDTITLKPGGKTLTLSAQNQKLLKRPTLTKKAVLQTYETVVLTIPASGSTSVVAAREQLVAGKGE